MESDEPGISLGVDLLIFIMANFEQQNNSVDGHIWIFFQANVPPPEKVEHKKRGGSLSRRNSKSSLNSER